MGHLKREVGFYLISTGLMVYLLLLSAILVGPVLKTYHGTLHADDPIVYGFLTILFYPLALFLIHKGNHYLELFKFKTALALTGLPLLTNLGIFDHLRKAPAISL